MRVTLIQCTNSKRDSQCKAAAMYDESEYYKKMRRFAKAKGNEWYILSAKHGLLYPDKIIEPYDSYGLSDTQAAEIATELSDKGVSEVEIIAGKKYTDPLTPELERMGIDVIEHCRGMMIGERMKELNTLVDNMEHDTLC